MTLHMLYKHSSEGVPADIKAKVIFMRGGDSPMSCTDISRALGVIVPSTVRSICLRHEEKQRLAMPNKKLQAAMLRVDMQGTQSSQKKRTQAHDIAVFCAARLQLCDAKRGVSMLAKTFKISMLDAAKHYKCWRNGCRIRTFS